MNDRDEVQAGGTHAFRDALPRRRDADGDHGPLRPHRDRLLAIRVLGRPYVLILEVGYKVRATAPIYKDVPVGTRAVDPVVQSLVLTDIVVGVVVMALILALALQIHKRSHTLNPDDLHVMEG